MEFRAALHDVETHTASLAASSLFCGWGVRVLATRSIEGTGEREIRKWSVGDSLSACQHICENSDQVPLSSNLSKLYKCNYDLPLIVLWMMAIFYISETARCCAVCLKWLPFLFYECNEWHNIIIYFCCRNRNTRNIDLNTSFCASFGGFSLSQGLSVPGLYNHGRWLRVHGPSPCPLTDNADFFFFCSPHSSISLRVTFPRLHNEQMNFK